MEDFRLPGRNRLAATWYGADRARGAVLLAGAMGVPRRFYTPFAQHLTAHGLSVLTFDYHGIAGSAPPRLRGFETSIRSWGIEDLPCALAAAAEWAPQLPLLYVGHSVGGQILGLMPGAQRIQAALLVAAQFGYWKGWPGLSRAGMWVLWNLGIPVLVPLFGCFPMGKLGMGEDLPAGVAREWTRWGRHPDYLFGFEDASGYKNFSAPLRSYAVADDGFAPVSTVEALYRRYGSPHKELKVLQPEAGEKLGHFGFFRKSAQAHWGDAVEWLLRHCGASASAPASALGPR